MAALNFPEALSDGQTWEADTGVIYVYKGVPPNGFWSATSSQAGQEQLDARYVEKSGDDMTGNLRVMANVGIGIDAPRERLHVYDAGANLNALIESGDENVWLGFKDSTTSGDASVYLGAVGDDLRFAAGGQVKATLANTGNLGIATSTPTNKITVGGTYAYGFGHERTDTNQSIQTYLNDAGYARIDFNGGGQGAGLGGANNHYLISYGGSHTDAGDFAIKNTSTTGDLAFYTDYGKVFYTTPAGTTTFNKTVQIREALDFADGDVLRFGSSDDVQIDFNSNGWLYMDFLASGIIFQDGGSNVMRLEDSGVFRPEADGGGSIGTTSVRWADGYFDNLAVTSTITVRGAIDLADNDILRFGSGDDCEFFCNGSHMYMDLNSGIGNFYIRDGSTTRYTFDDNGSFTATGNVTAYSDITLKRDIEVISGALDKVSAIRGVTYNRTDLPEEPRQAGVIAQEVEKVLPEVVLTDEEGIKSVAYGNLVGLLIEAVKELKAEIEVLKGKN